MLVLVHAVIECCFLSFLKNVRIKFRKKHMSEKTGLEDIYYTGRGGAGRGGAVFLLEQTTGCYCSKLPSVCHEFGLGGILFR